MFTGPDMQSVGTALKALSNPWRRAMLEHLAVQPCNPARLFEYVPVTEQTASYHLKVLRDAHLIHYTWDDEGRCRYELNSARIEQVKRYVDTCLQPAWYREQQYAVRVRDRAGLDTRQLTDSQVLSLIR